MEASARPLAVPSEPQSNTKTPQGPSFSRASAPSALDVSDSRPQEPSCTRPFVAHASEATGGSRSKQRSCSRPLVISASEANSSHPRKRSCSRASELDGSSTCLQQPGNSAGPGESSSLPVRFSVYLVSGDAVDADFIDAVNVADVLLITADSLGVEPAQLELLFEGEALDADTSVEHLPVDSTLTAVLRDHLVKVCCRVRPLSAREQEQESTNATKAISTDTIEMLGQGTFEFDAVFAPGNQEQIFDECSDLVHSVVDGSSGSIFAYGRAGSGKTFTMFGADPPMQGIVPRTCRELFQAIEQRETHDFSVTCSFLEVAGSQLFDGLSDVVRRREPAGLVRLRVRTPRQGKPCIENLSDCECTSAEAMLAAIERGQRNRVERAVESGRDPSHSTVIIIVKVASIDRSSGATQMAHLFLCDLVAAGRMFESAASGTRSSGRSLLFASPASGTGNSQTTGQCLDPLGDVLDAIARRCRFIPYRSSPLTHMMVVLGAQAKSIVFVALSPASTDRDETLASLRWARRIYLAGRSMR